MIRVAVIGGKLQGVEAVYLAKKAGFYSLLIDQNENPPASGMCDRFIQADIRQKNDDLLSLLKSADLIIPALEDDEALGALRRLSKIFEKRMAFDFNAYDITSSKRKSDRLFQKNNIPAPVYYPGGFAPYIAKPVRGSGSVGVRYLNTERDAAAFFNTHSPEEWVVQEYLHGRSYSIEVIGEPGCYRAYQITEIHVDHNYDCRLVSCPCDDLTNAQKAAFSHMAIKIAGLLGLRGIMDVEGILHDGVMKVLEIDARLPSQTPIAVERSWGINLLAELYFLFAGAKGTGVVALSRATTPVPLAPLYTALEHVEVQYEPAFEVKESGERLMAQCAPLYLYKDFLGSDEVMTDYRKGDSVMRATLINSAQTDRQLQKKRGKIREIRA